MKIGKPSAEELPALEKWGEFLLSDLPKPPMSRGYEFEYPAI